MIIPIPTADEGRRLEIPWEWSFFIGTENDYLTTTALPILWVKQARRLVLVNDKTHACANILF